METVKVIDETRSRRYEQVSRDKVGQAILGLSEAAAYSERSREFTNAPLGAEQNLWFVVRALCGEYGVPYEAMVEQGRERATREY